MKRLLAVLAAILTLHSDVASSESGYHEAVFKSVRRADRECSIFLRDGTCGKDDCSVRCRGLVTRFWNDSVGVPAVTIDRFYKPAHDDYEYYDLTEQCVGEVVAAIPCTDVCGRADSTVQCYNDQYGKLDKKNPKFVPFTKLQHSRILRECAVMLGISRERLYLFRKNGVEYYQDAKCLLRCFMLREGLYTDEDGPHFKQMSLQCEGNYNDGAYRSNAKSCISNLQNQYLDRCSLAYRIADECVNGEVAVKNIFVGAVVQLSPPDLTDLLPGLPTLPPIKLPTLPTFTLFPAQPTTARPAITLFPPLFPTTTAAPQTPTTPRPAITLFPTLFPTQPTTTTAPQSLIPQQSTLFPPLPTLFPPTSAPPTGSFTLLPPLPTLFPPVGR